MGNVVRGIINTSPKIRNTKIKNIFASGAKKEVSIKDDKTPVNINTIGNRIPKEVTP